MNGPSDKLKAIKTERRQQKRVIIQYLIKPPNHLYYTFVSWKSSFLLTFCFNFYILKPNGLLKEKTFAYSLVFPVTQWADFSRGSCLLNCLDVKCVHSFNNLDRNHLLKKLLLDWLSISGSVVLSNLPFHCALRNPLCSYKPHLRKNI